MQGLDWFIIQGLDWFIMQGLDWLIMQGLDWFIMHGHDWFIMQGLDWDKIVAVWRQGGGDEIRFKMATKRSGTLSRLS